MKLPTHAIQLLIVAALSGLPPAASAGELAASSRASISISITIPPHLVVNRVAPAEGAGPRNEGQGFCIAANGLANFHLVVLGSARAAQPAATPIASSNCGMSSPEEWKVAGPLAGVDQHQPQPLTILVVPD